MHRRLLTLAWSSSQGGGTLAIGATARLLSRLTPSPLLNGVLPALATLPLLVPLPQRIRLGYLIQLLSLLLLLLPLVPVIGVLQAGDRPQPDPSTDQGGEALRLEPGGVLQGLLFGGLFALLPLWVRQEAAGNCFDFGLVLTAYGLGRTGAEAWGLRLPPRLPYLLMAAVLVATQWVDGWGPWSWSCSCPWACWRPWRTPAWRSAWVRPVTCSATGTAWSAPRPWGA